MKLYQNKDAGFSRSHTCCSLEDVEDARSVARHLGIPYYVFNFSDDFREKVIGPFACSYLHGETPNPCIDCNRHMKFGRLFARADVLLRTGFQLDFRRNAGASSALQGADPLSSE